MKRAPHTLVAIALAWSAVAHGQSDRELATRQDLIREARELRDKGDHAGALDLAKRGAAIRMTTSLRMFVAQEEAAVGRVADAYGNARQCVVEAEGDANLHDRDRVLAACRAVVDAVEKRVGRITLKLRVPPSGVRVTLSGEEVNVALLGEPYVVAAGKVNVSVTAAGYLPYKSDVDVPAGGATEVAIELVDAPRAIEGQLPADAEATPRATRDWAGPVALGGAGIVALAVGTGFYVQAGSTYASLKAQCTSASGCTPLVYANEGSTVRQDNAIGVGGWIAGGALVAGGIAWFVLTAPKETPHPTARMRVWLNPVSRAVGVEGSF